MTDSTDLGSQTSAAELHDSAQTESSAEVTCLSIVVPTRNESGNIEPLISQLRETLADLSVEVVFVDDSDDGTPQMIESVAARLDDPNFGVQLVHRTGAARHHGLSGAVLRGLEASRHRWVCVMDGDLQHPPAVIRDLLERAVHAGSQLVAASRYVDEGSNAGLGNRSRRAVSALSGWAAKSLFDRQLDKVSDPMSGFFLVDTGHIDLGLLRPRGFKILLEILVSHPDLAVAEVPFHFGSRQHGDSKASTSQGWQFCRQLLELKRTSNSRLTWRYDIHGVIAVESDRALPELEKFLTRHVSAAPTIQVRVEDLGHLPYGESIDATETVPAIRYRERAGFAMSLRLGPAMTEVAVSPFVARSPHVMYTNVVEPILRWRLVELGYALVHAACFAEEDDAYLVTARTDTGKTTTMLKVLDRSSLSFVSDDLILMSDKGQVMTFPKPLTISKHTVHALRNTTLTRRERLALIPQSRVHSREGRLFAFLLTKYRLPVASINAVMQRVVPPPKYHVERLVRGVTSRSTATAQGMFIIQRGGVGQEHVETPEALEILLANCDDAFGFPPYEALERLLLASSDSDLKTEERRIIATALGHLPVMVMRSDTLDWAERIPEAVEAWGSDEDRRTSSGANSIV